MNKSSKININASTLVDLKAELFKKQEQLKRDRLQPSGSSSSSSRSKQNDSKKPSIWSKKNAGVKARAEKDLEQIQEERNQLEQSRNKLEAKAKFYEKMTQDGFTPDADSEERFLVDFEKKAFDQRSEVKSWEAGPLERGQTRTEGEEGRGEGHEDDDIPPPDNPEEEWVDYTDTLGRSRRCMKKDLPQLISMDKRLNPQVFEEKERTEAEKKKEDLPDLLSNDMYREMLRKKWEAEEEAAAKGPQGPTHYQNVKYDEVREMGVGYFDFAKDQSSRNEQMETLQLLRDETLDQRQRREKLKLKRKAAMQARLAKVKERKRQRGELVEDDQEEEEEEEKKEEQPKADHSSLERDVTQKDTAVREWDVGKETASPWEQKLSNLRNERPSEFAPPSIYESSSQNKRHQPRTNYPPPKDYSSTYGNAKKKSGNKSNPGSFANWNIPSGSKDGTQPFVAGGVSNASSIGGSGGQSSSFGASSSATDDSILSGLSFFRQNTSK